MLALIFSTPLFLSISASIDCYQFRKESFAMIADCELGCEYAYKVGGHDNVKYKVSGGCSSTSYSSCRTSGKTTVCGCISDRCNIVGYEMPYGD